MVTQITLKTEGPPGLPSDRLPAEADPRRDTQGATVARSSYILADYIAVTTLVTRESLCRVHERIRLVIESAVNRLSGQGLRIKPTVNRKLFP